MPEKKILTLPGALAMGDPVAAYSVRACRALGWDMPTAMLISQLWFLSERAGRAEISPTAASLQASIGMTERRWRRSREVLRLAGWIAERETRVATRTRILTTVCHEKIIADLLALPDETAGGSGAEPPHETAPSKSFKSEEAPSVGAETDVREEKIRNAESADGFHVEPPPAQPSTVGSALALAPPPGPLEEPASKQKIYRVDAGALSYEACTAMVAGMDGRKLGRDDLTALLTALSSARCGWEKSPCPMPFATFTAGDCALVRKHLHTLKPTEMLMAVLGATHIDTWARDRGLTLAQIFGKASHYVGVFQARRLRPDRARAAQVFLDVYNEAQNLTVDASDTWARVRERLVFMQAAEAIDWARQMARELDAVRCARGEPPTHERLHLPEIAPTAQPRALGAAR